MSRFVWTLALPLVVGWGISLGTVVFGGPSPGESKNPESTSEGRRLFTQMCVPCHQLDGRGVAGVYPPLTPYMARYVQVPEGRVYLIRVVLFGLMGQMESDGRVYNNIMLPMGRSLTDQQIADLLNFIFRELDPQNLPEDFKDISPDEVAHQRKQPRGLADGLKERDLLLKKLKELNKKESQKS